LLPLFLAWTPPTNEGLSLGKVPARVAPSHPPVHPRSIPVTLSQVASLLVGRSVFSFPSQLLPRPLHSPSLQVRAMIFSLEVAGFRPKSIFLFSSATGTGSLLQSPAPFLSLLFLILNIFFLTTRQVFFFHREDPSLSSAHSCLIPNDVPRSMNHRAPSPLHR